VEPQWHRLREMETEKGRLWGVAIFGGKEGEEARRLHDVGGAAKSDAAAGEAKGGGWHLEVENDERKLGW
jgi:hypothetical protein